MPPGGKDKTGAQSVVAKVLVAAQDINSHVEKGDIIANVTEGGDFGAKEVLPNFIRLTVSDATQEQAVAFLEHWGKVFWYSIDAENAQGYRITITADPAAVAAGGRGGELRQELKDYVLAGLDMGLNVTLFDQSGTSLTVDVEKPGGEAIDFQQAKEQLDDKFGEVVSTSRYYFSDADVDAAVAAGGEFTRTRQQVLNQLMDKLDD